MTLVLLMMACKVEQTPDDPAFSTLSQQASGAEVLAGYQIQFPHDHGSHPEFAIEWWYITANLTDEQGIDYGLQWTLFRFLSDSDTSPWADQQQYMAHVGLHSRQHSWFEERFARGGVGNAAVENTPFKAYLDNWQWQAQGNSLFPSTLSFTLQQQVEIELALDTNKPFVFHGEQGYSKKLANNAQASYYYSQPHIHVNGSLNIDGESKQVDGQAWFDHEWTSQYLDPEGLGWDWFSIHLDSGQKLMLFNVRHARYGDFWSGSLVQENDTKVHLTPSDINAKVIERVKLEGRNFPVKWHLSLPNHGLDLVSQPIKTDQLHPGLFSYYEGAIEVSGSASGVGFMELTGY